MLWIESGGPDVEGMSSSLGSEYDEQEHRHKSESEEGMELGEED